MHGTVIESPVALVSPPSFSELPAPLVFDLEPEAGGRVFLFAILVPLLTALLTPFWLVGAQLASDPAARAILSERPLLGVQLLMALVAVVWIFGWPLLNFARRGLEHRRISIDATTVHCIASGPFGTSTWSEPISGYAGIMPEVRTSLSGARHLISLVHPKASRCVRLPSRDVPEDALQSVARLFVLAEIPSREAVSVMHCNEYFRVGEPKGGLAAV